MEPALSAAPVERLVGRPDRIKFFADVEGDISEQAATEQRLAWERLGSAIYLFLPFKPSVGDELQITVDETLFVFTVERVRIGVSMDGDGLIGCHDDQHELVLSLIDYV